MGPVVNIMALVVSNATKMFTEDTGDINANPVLHSRDSPQRSNHMRESNNL